MTRTAIVLFNLGGPDGPDAVEPFLYNLFSDPAIIGLPGPLRRFLACRIARRRAPIARHIYAQIGGGSPLLRNTEAQARALDEVVGQDLVPEIDDLLRLRKEAMSADVEEKVLIVNRSADPPDIYGISFDDGGGDLRLRQQIRRGQACRPRADDEDLRMLHLRPPAATATRSRRGRPGPTCGSQAKSQR